MDIYHIGKQIDANGDNVLATCAVLNMTLVAYSPLSAYPFVMTPIMDPIVGYIAAKLSVTPAQVILKWILQQGALAIPRSTDHERLTDNLAAMKMLPLTPEDMDLLSSITQLIRSPSHVPS